MIIDCHAHIGYENDYEQQDVELLLKKMSEAKVDKCVIFPFAPLSHSDSYYGQNEEIAKLNNPFIPFGRINLLSSDYMDEIDHISSLNLKGVKLHNTLNENFSEYPEFFKKLDELGLPILVHTGNLQSQRVEYLKDLPCFSSPIIIGHGGKDYFNDAISLVNDRPNFYIELSLLSLMRTRKVLDLVVDKRKILFGSDAPYHHPKLEIEKVKYACEACNKRELIKDILGNNLRRIIK